MSDFARNRQTCGVFNNSRCYADKLQKRAPFSTSKVVETVENPSFWSQSGGVITKNARFLTVTLAKIEKCRQIPVLLKLQKNDVSADQPEIHTFSPTIPQTFVENFSRATTCGFVPIFPSNRAILSGFPADLSRKTRFDFRFRAKIPALTP
ncbi:MAG: hypothetical protein MJ082_00110 [Clostridia bacterium]|nr:hypothetical protein [Clostridia bacterium]